MARPKWARHLEAHSRLLDLGWEPDIPVVEYVRCGLLELYSPSTVVCLISECRTQADIAAIIKGL